MGATTKNVTENTFENYEKLCQIKLSNGVPVEKYRSKRTGLHIVLAKVEGPLVSGYFTLGKTIRS